MLGNQGLVPRPCGAGDHQGTTDGCRGVVPNGELGPGTGLRKIAKRALDGHLPSNLKFIKICEEYGALKPPPAATGGGVILLPNGMSLDEWFERAAEEAPGDQE